MAYRDDAEALFQRAHLLQKELDHARAELAAERARTRGAEFHDEPTRPGIRELRALPDPSELLSRLIRDIDHDVQRAPPPPPPQVHPIVWPHVSVDTVRSWLGYLDTNGLALVAAIIEKLLADPSARERFAKRFVAEER